MALKHGILGFLIYGVATGYELNKTFKDSVDNFWHATPSQIYRELDWLEAHGLAASEMVIQNGKPNKKTFQITDQGREAFMDWLAHSEEEPVTFRSSFLMRLFFSGLCSGAEAIRILEEFKIRCAAYWGDTDEWDQTIDHYRDAVEDNTHSFYWGLTSDFGKRYLKMSEDWADDAIAKIKEREGTQV